jgi:hypothetical protein
MMYSSLRCSSRGLGDSSHGYGCHDNTDSDRTGRDPGCGAGAGCGACPCGSWRRGRRRYCLEGNRKRQNKHDC